MSAPDLCDIGTRELPPGNGAPGSQGGRQRCPLDKVQSSGGFHQRAPLVLLLLGVASRLSQGQTEPEDISIRGDKGSGKPEWADMRMLAESLTQVSESKNL